jgi:hypothetical protein
VYGAGSLGTPSSSLKRRGSSPSDAVAAFPESASPSTTARWIMSADRVHQVRPPIVRARELGLDRSGEPVALRALIGLADAQPGLEPSSFFEAMERRVESAVATFSRSSHCWRIA